MTEPLADLYRQLHALLSMPAFRGESSATTWLYAIARNVYRKRMVQEQRGRRPAPAPVVAPTEAVEVAGAPGVYRFTAVYDGPDRWPTPVKLEVNGILFDTNKVLEWPVNWAKYRDIDGSDRRLMDSADQVSVRFYDSELISISAYRGGAAIEHKEPKGEAPYVRAEISGGGRGVAPFLLSGFEVTTAQGDVITNVGGGGGNIFEDRWGHDQRQGVAVDWRESLPSSFHKADRLMVRYVDPSATLVVDETWEMPPVK